MLGSAFTATLREAQAGDEKAFTRLWRDANPIVTRYLRVVGADDPYDAACEGWITAVRGLVGFTGDESAWRLWLLACARLRAEQGIERQGWATVTPIDRRAFAQASAASAAATAALAATAATMAARARDDEHDLEALLASTPVGDPQERGLDATIVALRALPLGQGEILVLRLGGALPVRAVSDLVGSDSESVRRSEARGLERLGTDADLLAWSLDAPASPAELADERVALGAFRSIPRPPAWSVPRTRVITVGRAPARRAAGRRLGISNAAGRSRTALLGIATISASVMSLGGLSAAAYVGALPSSVQQVMHDTIGAPAPGAPRATPAKTPSRKTPAPGRASSASVPPSLPRGVSPTTQLVRPPVTGTATSTATGSASSSAPSTPATTTAERTPTFTATTGRPRPTPTTTGAPVTEAPTTEAPAPTTTAPGVDTSTGAPDPAPASDATAAPGADAGQTPGSTAGATPDPTSSPEVVVPAH